MISYLIPDPVAKMNTVETASGGENWSTSKPLPMTPLSSTTSPLRISHSSSAVEPGTFLIRKSNTPFDEAAEGGDAMARNAGFGASGTRSWRYCPGTVKDPARSGLSETSMLTWKSVPSSAAGLTTVRGACVQVIESWRTAATTASEERPRRRRGATRRRRLGNTDMGRDKEEEEEKEKEDEGVGRAEEAWRGRTRGLGEERAAAAATTAAAAAAISPRVPVNWLCLTLYLEAQRNGSLTWGGGCRGLINPNARTRREAADEAGSLCGLYGLLFKAFYQIYSPNEMTFIYIYSLMYL